MSQTFFDEAMAFDIRNCFLKGGEFAGLISLGGNRIKAVVDPLPMAWPEGSDERMGVAYEGVTLSVALDDLPDALVNGRQIEFNGGRWYVMHADREELRTIQLYRERT